MQGKYGFYPQNVECQSDIKFKWNHLVKGKNNLKIKQGKFSFLEPIIIS